MKRYEGILMRTRSVFYLCLAILLAALTRPAHAQSDTITAKKPVFSGACVFCPWGEIGEYTRDALKPLGYEVQVCYNCNLVDSPRFVSERRIAPQLTDRNRNLLYTSTRPDSPVDFGVTERNRLYWAYHALHEYKGDTEGKRLRLIATIDDPTYFVVAVRKRLSSTDLKEILQRPNLQLRAEMSPPVQLVLDYYGASKAAIEARGGKIEGPSGLEPRKLDYDLIVTALGSLANKG
jgi:hypothetical protein